MKKTLSIPGIVLSFFVSAFSASSGTLDPANYVVILGNSSGNDYIRFTNWTTSYYLYQSDVTPSHFALMYNALKDAIVSNTVYVSMDYTSGTQNKITSLNIWKK